MPVVASGEHNPSPALHVGGPRHSRRRPTVREALATSSTCTIRHRMGIEIECPNCLRWVRLTRFGTLPKHAALDENADLDADGNCFGTGHKPHRVWGSAKVLDFGGRAGTIQFDQWGNLRDCEFPYSLDACQLAKTANAKSNEAANARRR